MQTKPNDRRPSCPSREPGRTGPRENPPETPVGHQSPHDPSHAHVPCEQETGAEHQLVPPGPSGEGPPANGRVDGTPVQDAEDYDLDLCLVHDQETEKGQENPDPLDAAYLSLADAQEKQDVWRKVGRLGGW